MSDRLSPGGMLALERLQDLQLTHRDLRALAEFYNAEAANAERDESARWGRAPKSDVVEMPEPAPPVVVVEAPTGIFHLRASSAPLAFACPGSLRATVPVDEAHEAASVGTATHAALRSLAETGALDWSSVPRICSEHGVPESEVRMLCAMATKLWEEVSESFPNSMTEVALETTIEGIHITGHADVVSISGTVCRGGDWKTGRKDSDYGEQMRTYCALILLQFPELTECSFTALWVRDKEAETFIMLRDELPAWVDRLRDEVANWDGTFRPGAHCQYCRRSHECPAAHAMMRRDVSAFTGEDLAVRAESALAEMSPEDIVDLHTKAKLVESLAKRVRDAIKSHVSAYGDVVSTRGRLTIKPTSKRHLKPSAAWEVLESVGFGDAEFSEVMTLSLSKCEQLVRSKAPKRGGAGAVRELGSALEAAGAIYTTESQELAFRRA